MTQTLETSEKRKGKKNKVYGNKLQRQNRKKAEAFYYKHSTLNRTW